MSIAKLALTIAISLSLSSAIHSSLDQDLTNPYRTNPYISEGERTMKIYLAELYNEVSAKHLALRLTTEIKEQEKALETATPAARKELETLIDQKKKAYDLARSIKSQSKRAKEAAWIAANK